jgi:hypothetical protein
LGLLSKDSRGFALSLDLLLALIPLTLVLGFVAADMDNLLYQMEDTVFRSSMDRAAGDAVSTLLETSGNPPNWEDTGIANIVGLAQFDPSKNGPIEGTIDPVKLGAVTVPQVQNLVGDNYDFYMNVSTINKTGTPQSLKTLGNSSFANANDVVRVERVVQASKFKVVSSLVGQIRYVGGIRMFNIPSFQTSFISNQTFDYWILIANVTGFTNATVNINNNPINFTAANMNNPVQINSDFLYMNASNPSLYYNNTVTLNATGSFPSSMDIYIVQTPKNVTSSQINTDTVIPKKSDFVFYLWLKDK